MLASESSVNVGIAIVGGGDDEREWNFDGDIHVSNELHMPIS
jgi:hypothetical protein